MKRTKVSHISEALPAELKRYITGADVFDSSCSPEAKVYFIDKDEGYYLKFAKPNSLSKEAIMSDYFHSLGLGAEVLFYSRENERDVLLSARVKGEDCTHANFLSEPRKLASTIAKELRRLHEIDFSACPIKERTNDYISTVFENYRTGNYDTSHFPDSFGYANAQDAIRVFEEGMSALKTDTLIHGDYCLPNIMLNDDFSLSGFIDLGAGGVADRHIDLFWGAWTLGFNLGTDEYRRDFFDAYGRDKVDEDIIRVIAAAEVFG